MEFLAYRSNVPTYEIRVTAIADVKVYEKMCTCGENVTAQGGLELRGIHTCMYILYYLIYRDTLLALSVM